LRNRATIAASLPAARFHAIRDRTARSRLISPQPQLNRSKISQDRRRPLLYMWVIDAQWRGATPLSSHAGSSFTASAVPPLALARRRLI